MGSRARSTRRLRWLAAALVVAAAAVWMARDLPRRLLEARVADLLQAEVRLDGFRIASERQLELFGLEVEALATLPMVERVTFDEVWIEGTLAGLRTGRVERLTVSGMDARLTTAAELVEGPRREISIAVLELEPAAVTVVGRTGATAAWTLEASLRDVGGTAAGSVRVRSPALELEPLVELAALWVPEARAAGVGTGVLDGLAGDLELGERPRLTLRADRGGIEVWDLTLEVEALEVDGSVTGDRLELAAAAGVRVADASRRLELGAVRVTAAAAPVAGDGNRLRVDFGADLELLEDARLAADWDLEHGRLLGFAGHVDGFDLGRLAGDFSVAGDADLMIRGEEADLVFAARVRPRALASGSASLAAAGAHLAVDGSIPLENLTATPPRLAGPLRASLELPSMTGAVAGVRLPAAAFPAAAEFDGEIVDDGGAGPALAGTWTLTSAAGGRLAATGSVSFEPAAADLAWSWRGGELGSLARLLQQAGIVAGDGLAAGGRLSGRGRLRGALSDPQIDAELILEDAASAPADATWRIAGGAAAIALHRPPRPRPAELRVGEAAAVLRVADRQPIAFGLRATVPFAGDLGSGELRDAVLEAPGLGRIEIDGRWRRRGGFEADGSVRGRELDLAGWQQVLRLDVPDLALAGLVGGDLRGAIDGDGWRLHGPVEVAGAGFSSAHGGRVLEGLAADWTVEVSAAGERPIAAKASGSSSGFLVLWDTLFADLSNMNADWQVEATVDPADSSWRLAAEVAVADGPVLEGDLRRPAAGREGLDYTLVVRVEDLGRTHDRYLRAILDQYFDRPELGGRLTADLSGTVAPGGATLAGRLRLGGLDWEAAGEELNLSGFDLDLPLDLRFGAGGGERQRGHLSFDRLSFRGLRLPPAETALWTENDSLELEDPLSFQILEGSVTLGRLKLGDLSEPDRYLESSLTLTGLSLGRISQALEVFPLEGSLDGELPKVRLTADTLRVEGGGEIGVFGGTVLLRDISGTDVLTPFPSLTLSAEFRAIDLGRLTRRLDFGEMTGILQGSITACELFRKLPVRCAMRFETVDQPGVPRTVDVKAINNLSILGTGAGTNVFDRGLQRFLDRYRYDRLAAEVRLDGDVLLLRGLEKRGDQELFMKGRFPFPIDIVNVQPGRTVSFQTMLRRLQNLDFSTATTSPKKP